MLEMWNNALMEATQYVALLALVAGVLGFAALAGVAVWAKRTTKPLRPIALSLSMNLALLLNAEGMWEVATQKLALPAVFAGLIFAVFEICFLTSTSLAAEHYRKHKTPGRMLWVALIIAVLSGVIVASNAASGTERLLRLTLPIVIFLMWWAALTAAGVVKSRGRFAYSPRRLAELWGLLIPESDESLESMKADRQVRRMVINQQRALSSFVAISQYGTWRLKREARTASSAVVEQVVDQLARIGEVSALISAAPVPVKTLAAGEAETASTIKAEAQLGAPLLEASELDEFDRFLEGINTHAPKPANAPVSPAPTKPNFAVAMSAAVRGLMEGAATPSILAEAHGVSVQAVRRYAAVVRELHANPHAEIDTKKRSVNPELVGQIREWARTQAAR